MQNGSSQQHEIILFFDGVCNLCNGTIDFFIKKDHKRKFKYATLQWKIAPELIGDKATKDLNSVVLYFNGQTYYKSQAILTALKILGFPYSILFIFILIPTSLSNLIYDYIANNRYRFFGKKSTCRLPSLEEKELFLD